MIFAEGLSHKITFLVDTSAEINVIKKRNLHPNIKINTDNIIAGITEGKIEIIGSTTINYCKHEIQLHFVKDDIPIV